MAEQGPNLTTTGARCRYDCYQINLQVNLSEEDSCLYSRYGQSLFNIRNCNSKNDCGCCRPSQPNCNNASLKGCPFPVKMPDAVILSVDIDRCDCTKSIFSLYVRLPCKSFKDEALKCAIQAFADESAEYTVDATGTPNADTVAIVNAINQLNLDTNTLVCDIANCTYQYTDVITTDANTVQTDITNLETAIQTAITDGASASAYKDLQKALHVLSHEVDSLLNFLNRGIAADVYEGQKFCITSGASGHEREVITFNVAPLPRQTVSTGVFNKCYTYEATRVPCRVLCPEALQICSKTTGLDYFVEGCCGICNVVDPLLVPDTLRIMFPMTKQIKCLVPDFGITGTYLNAALGTVDTLVRLVSCSPCKFCLPAKLSFDTECCMVCLDISTEYIMSASTYTNDIAGYEHRFSCCEEFGSGCKSRCGCEVAQLKQTLASLQAQFAGDFNNKDGLAARAMWMTLGNTVFQLLARSKRIDVQGVNKCAENVLFNFQVCYFPYRGFCVDVCGCKPVKTICAPDAIENYQGKAASVMLGAGSSFRVQAEGEFSYEFLKVCDNMVATVNPKKPRA